MPPERLVVVFAAAITEGVVDQPTDEELEKYWPGLDPSELQTEGDEYDEGGSAHDLAAVRGGGAT